MITEPKIEDRSKQHYVGIRTQVTVQEMGPDLVRVRERVYYPRLQGGLYGCRPEGAGQRPRSGEGHKT